MITIPLLVFGFLSVLIFCLGVCFGGIWEMSTSIKEMTKRIGTLQEIENDYKEFIEKYKEEE